MSGKEEGLGAVGFVGCLKEFGGGFDEFVAEGTDGIEPVGGGGGGGSIIFLRFEIVG